MAGSPTIDIDPTNADQLRAWDGDEGAYWAEHADWFDRSVAEHHRHLLAAARIAGHERVLDVGCGTGQTTRDAARIAHHGAAVGVDLSSAMLAVARRRAAADGLANASFVHADAQVHPFEPASYDLVLSRTGAMFFGDQEAAFANLARALRPGGRLALLAWQAPARNEWIGVVAGSLAGTGRPPEPPPGAPGPFSLADPDHVDLLLRGAGFADVRLAPVTAGMWFGADVDEAHRTVVGLMAWMLQGRGEADRRRALDALQSALAARASADGVVLGSAAWLITAVRG